VGRRKIEVVTVDFETEEIKQRPVYPPKAVGVSIKYRGKKARYFAWGHPTKNNSTKAQAGAALKDAYRSGLPLLFQNGMFDVDVAEEEFKLKPPPWDKYHDTLYLLFLHDPHARSLSLKPAAEKLLGMKPEERNAVNEWLLANGFIKKLDQKNAGAFISKAPGDIVGRYANGDTDRTELLFDFLIDKILEAGMGAAYDRERRLMPILLRNSREGMHVDVRALERDLAMYEKAQEKTDDWLRKRLKAPELNVDSDDEVAEALTASGVVTEWVMTATGKRSTAKKNMTVGMFKDKRVFTALGYRNRLQTCITVFMRPWLEMARSTGRIFTQWNQVRQSHGDESQSGTRTGRLSCSPNFQNVPKDWYDKNDGFTKELFAALAKLLGVPELPLMRKYITADPGGVFGHRDYNQQEPRILAHFENDKLCAQYNDDPRTDVHTYVQEQIKIIANLELARRPVKILNLGLIYGMGLGKLADGMGVDVETAKKVKAAQRKAIPGLAELDREIKFRGRSGQAVKTWGGRLYYVEPPKMIGGELKTFEYKLLNYLIQGSAADCTKEAIIRYDEIRKDGRFLVTVHDECNISAPKKAIKQEMLVLRKAMESVEFDVPMISDAKYGPTWGDLKKLEEKR
jgi:DNA polymerase I-like protein with 3'-5' exonuclease and polymerase domains